ncbi:hypothetical protein SCALM49S_04453 [Streptomyces californicus]
MALPGRRREIDDDLPEEALAVAAEPVDGEGRRARRLRAAAQAEAAAEESGERTTRRTPPARGSTSRPSSPPTRTPRTRRRTTRTPTRATRTPGTTRTSRKPPATTRRSRSSSRTTPTRSGTDSSSSPPTRTARTRSRTRTPSRDAGYRTAGYAHTDRTAAATIADPERPLQTPRAVRPTSRAVRTRAGAPTTSTAGTPGDPLPAAPAAAPAPPSPGPDRGRSRPCWPRAAPAAARAARAYRDRDGRGAGAAARTWGEVRGCPSPTQRNAPATVTTEETNGGAARRARRCGGGRGSRGVRGPQGARVSRDPGRRRRGRGRARGRCRGGGDETRDEGGSGRSSSGCPQLNISAKVAPFLGPSSDHLLRVRRRPGPRPVVGTAVARRPDAALTQVRAHPRGADVPQVTGRHGGVRRGGVVAARSRVRYRPTS